LTRGWDAGGGFVTATQNKFKDLYAARFGNDSFDTRYWPPAGEI
jgi:hypothetical protein